MATSIEIIATQQGPPVTPLRRLLVGIAHTYVTRIAVGVVGLATTICVARLLGPEGRGFFAVATAITTIALQLGNMGLHASNTFYVARSAELAPELVGNSLAIALVMGSGLGLFTLLLAKFMPALTPLSGSLLILAVAFIPVALSYLLLQNLLLGMDQVRSYNVIELTTKCLALLLILVLWAIHRSSVASLFAASMSSAVIGTAWAAWLLRGMLSRPIKLSITLFRKTFSLGLRAYWAALFSFLVLRIDLLMVKYLRGTIDAGYYSISATMADYAAMLPVVIGVLLFPRLAGMSRLRERFDLTRRITLITAAATLPLLVACGLFASHLVKLLFGEAFQPSAQAFALLLPGMFFLSLEVVLVQFLNSNGFPISVIIAWVGTCATNVLLNLWAIPHYGINGASIVSSITYFLAFVLITSIALFRAHKDESAPLILES